jgi:hypothetical protein
MSASRQYDLVVFGATGYTGKLTAEHIATSLPTDLRWALAGRSQSKLEAVAAECKALNSDRIQPGEHSALILSPAYVFVTWIMFVRKAKFITTLNSSHPSLCSMSIS